MINVAETRRKIAKPTHLMKLTQVLHELEQKLAAPNHTSATVFMLVKMKTDVNRLTQRVRYKKYRLTKDDMVFVNDVVKAIREY